jgi:inosine/xanthosine triphosphatase
MKIIVASMNPVKIRAALQGFQHMFPGESIEAQGKSVPSGVSHQPFSDDETFQGAVTRAHQAAQRNPQADFWIGIEGGVQPIDKDISAFAWVYICSKSQSGKGRTSAFFLPDKIAQLIRQGYELGDADDMVFGRHNSKQENGAVGLLTGDVIDRVALYEQAVIMALIPFKNPELYPTHLR